MRIRILALIAAIVGLMALATPAQAIKNGEADGNAHPYVGELFFYVPSSDEDTRFDDPGTWYTCTGTLISSTVVVTAGHCTFDIGLNGEDTKSGVGGNDVWISFAEKPDFDFLTPSSAFGRDENDERYRVRSAELNSSDEWIRATATPHPEYDDDAFFTHDVGVLELSEPVGLAQYGQLPTEGLLSRLYDADKQRRYTAIGYGLEGSGPKKELGGDTRRRADLRLVNLTGVGGLGRGVSAKFSSNANTGGTCFGDSGGPIFVAGTRTIVAVNSYVGNLSCAGTTGGYRIDQRDDLDFLTPYLTLTAAGSIPATST